MATPPETFPSGGKSLPLELFMPAASGRVPAVLILHGSFGMLKEYRADIVSFADALVETGIGAAIPHYLEATGTAPGLGILDEFKSGKIAAKLPLWRRACADALAAMAGDARFDAARMGVLGFSLGGNLALGLAMERPAVASIRGVADFFGPTDMLDTHWSRLPPVLIFHGEDDHLVEPTQSARLVAELEHAGRTKDTDFFYTVYEGQGHGFHGAELIKSRDRTVEFFQTVLQVSP